MTEKEKVVTTLRRQRGAYKGQLTRIVHFLDSENEKDKVEFKVKLENLKKIITHLHDLKIKFFEQIEDDAELQAEMDLFTEIEDEAEKLEVRLRKFLLSNNIIIENNEHSNCNFKLPDIPLPKFNGNYQDWYIFKDQFKTLIHSNDKLNDTQKLYYLKSTLSHSALDVVTADDSYESLFKALETRFENKRFIVNSHVNEILLMEMTSPDSAKNLRAIVDGCQKHIRALKSIGLELNQFSEIMLINIILRKLDKETKKQFELSLTSTELPNWQDFIDFLQKRCLVLENLQNNVCVKPKQVIHEKNQKVKNLFVKNNSYTAKNSCVICLQNHSIYKCDKFLKLNEYDRYLAAKKNNLCLNCLRSSHKIAQCKSSAVCDKCGRKHNFLLHRSTSSAQTERVEKSSGQQLNKEVVISPNENSDKVIEVASEVSQSLCGEVCLSNNSESRVLLTTCIIYVENSEGTRIPTRAILDSGSEINLMSNRIAQALSLKKNKTKILISGINGNVSEINSKVKATISNKNKSFSRTLQFLIMSKITNRLPASNINESNLEIPENINLADPNFGKSAKIDILIGAELFYEILKPEKFKISSLIFQNTAFGYIVSGILENKCQPKFCGIAKQIEDKIEENLQKFWEIESVDDELIPISPEDQYCESHFLKTYRRNNTGRFIVTMPLKEDPVVLENSRVIAEKRLKQLWNRLEKIPLLRTLYSDFMKEYENLGHMTKVSEVVDETGCYYLPHHGVYRPESSTTKLRVVFNASSPTSNGKSLNDILFKGQAKEDLYDIMIRFRNHKFVFIADIEKMYRQILMNPDQRKLLRILWKENIDAPIETYELNTVTYGTSCAPFLAIRTLKQLAEEEIEKYGKASKVLLNDTYMDDILSGEETLEGTKELQSELIKLLNSAGMHLHKWNANHPALLENVNNEVLEGYSFCENETKVLGVSWKPSLDVFTFKVKIDHAETLTKRTVLSDIARLFDPLGLLGPVITRAKTFMQDLWKLKLNWNDPIPDSIAQSWIQWANSLTSLENLKINRYVLNPCAQYIALHGFADASSIAFGASVYIQFSHQSETTCNLISSKSQIAPLKTITIPRLELSACLLLAKLVVKVLKALKLTIQDVYLYTDSQIALAWIQTPPWKLKTFVSNRVSKIQNCTKNFTWKHIPSSSNPSDLISRGLDAIDLVDNQLWWKGPDFLTNQTSVGQPENLPLSSDDQEIILKEMKDIPSDTVNIKKQKTCGLLAASVTDNNLIFNIFALTNDFIKLIRICRFIFRFIYNCRRGMSKSRQLPVPSLENTETFLIKQVQYECFAEDIKNLQNKRVLPGKSRLKFLNPFLDSENILRVGGRLENSNLPYRKKHPIVLPANHKLSEMIFEYLHKKFFHLGPQALLHQARQRYWIINGRALARKVVHKCVICFRNKPIALDQIMGNLPQERVNPSPPFQQSAIDFCGPFLIKYKNQRKGIYNKIYVALFICLATKAIHLDIVTDLKSDSFIATLKRFFARRGKSSTIMTDNGSTFVGANTEIKKLHAMLIKPDSALTNYLESEGINWKFIPPRSPNFGGLWEAGVKAFKYHLKRTLGNSRVTLEEFWTLTTQIEGILNSRPLTPLSSDANEIDVLTPGHFLIGRPITSLPEPDITHINENRLSHWQKLTKMIQVIWKKWQHDYLNHLQQRNKWFLEKKNLKAGCMVILKDENLPPGKWALGRILKVIPGSDEKVRVVEIKTLTGIVTRSISKICLLPIEEND